MSPLTYPCGCEYMYIETTDNGIESWWSELCEYHKQVMDEALEAESKIKRI